jgi:hypothetical protein
VSNSLREAILSLGLEDLIPLPEIAEAVRAEGVAASESALPELSSALIALLEEGLIQVSTGSWSEEPEVLDPVAARELLMVEGQYEWNSPADLVRRVYYVNVENLRVDVGDM